MRSTVIAAMTSAATTSGRRAAPKGFTVMSGAIVTAALFPDLGGGVNVGGYCHALRVASGGFVGWAKRSVPTTASRAKMVGTARRARPCPPYDFVTLPRM